MRVEGDVASALPMLELPMTVDGEEMIADRVERTGVQTLVIVIHQGKNRQVRRMCAAAGLTVTRLVRKKEGDLLLGDLKPGCWRYLTTEELHQLQG